MSWLRFGTGKIDRRRHIDDHQYNAPNTGESIHVGIM
jgi:hypothetical protein